MSSINQRMFSAPGFSSLSMSIKPPRSKQEQLPSRKERRAAARKVSKEYNIPVADVWDNVRIPIHCSEFVYEEETEACQEKRWPTNANIVEDLTDVVQLARGTKSLV